MTWYINFCLYILQMSHIVYLYTCESKEIWSKFGEQNLFYTILKISTFIFKFYRVKLRLQISLFKLINPNPYWYMTRWRFWQCTIKINACKWTITFHICLNVSIITFSLFMKGKIKGRHRNRHRNKFLSFFLSVWTKKHNSINSEIGIKAICHVRKWGYNY